MCESHGKKSTSVSLAALNYFLSPAHSWEPVFWQGRCEVSPLPAVLFLLCSFPPIVFLSFFGIASIGLSCLVALFLYHVVFGIQYLGILNGVAAFVIVGIGKHVLTPNLPVLP